MQRSRIWDERTTDCQLESSPRRARVVRGESFGKPSLLTLLHEIEVRVDWYQSVTVVELGKTPRTPLLQPKSLQDIAISSVLQR